uniref:Uncharacterized protein n=1 Tax=viral metagenome TaxID=1070528 RepID=A0A6C0ENC3_9ZZZZ
MTSVIINDNKKGFEKLIDIMSEYIPDNNYFTYNGKPILNNTTLNTSNDLSKIYYKSSSLNQFIKEIENGKYEFYLNQYNKSCIQRIYNNINESKCMSIKSYTNDKNIRINIINKSININSKITSFSLHDNIYDIIIEDNEEKEKEIEKEKELSMLEVIASTLNSSIKSQKIQDIIVSRYLENDKK